MKPRTYATPAAFKAALDQRLRKVAETGADLTRRRQLLVFDRYLARLTHVLGDAATLKGGLVLEVRLERARTTRDIDVVQDLLTAPGEERRVSAPDRHGGNWYSAAGAAVTSSLLVA